MTTETTVENNNDHDLSFFDTLAVLAVISVVTLMANYAGTQNDIIDSFIGILMIYAMLVVGLLLKKIVPFYLPAVAWVSLVSVVVTLPMVPYSGVITEYVKNLNFLSMLTPVLAYAAVAIAKHEVALFKTAGVKIVVISILVFTGTYIGSALVANGILSITG